MAREKVDRIRQEANCRKKGGECGEGSYVGMRLDSGA